MSISEDTPRPMSLLCGTCAFVESDVLQLILYAVRAPGNAPTVSPAIFSDYAYKFNQLIKLAPCCVNAFVWLGGGLLLCSVDLSEGLLI